MSQEFKLKFAQMQENNPNGIEEKADNRYYANSGYNRNLVFLLPNGNAEAFNYAYLLRLQYRCDEPAIYLIYTSCTVKIEGYGLQPLFLELFDQQNRIIECVDERYKALAENITTVTKVTVLQSK